VGLGEEVEAVIVRDDDQVLAALETGDFVSEWTPLRSAQLVLREATLSLGAESMNGWLVDARFGGTPAVAQNVGEGRAPGIRPLRPGQPAAELSGDQGDTAASDPDQDTAADTLDGEVTVEEPPLAATAPFRSLRGVLVTEDGDALVLGDTDAGLAGWLWLVAGEVTLPVVTLTRMPGERESWTLEAGGGTTLSGRLQGVDEAPAAFAPRMVRGTLDVGDLELEVHGVLRPPDAE
jgi:hypothetical protein